MKSTHNKGLKVLTEPTELQKLFIDEYHRNGFNKVQAAMTVNPEWSYATAQTWASVTFKNKVLTEYKASKTAELKAATGIETVHVLRELMNFAYSDATVFLGLTLAAIKELPPDIKRCISSVDHQKKTYKDSMGQVVTEETFKIKLVDKLQAVNMLAKHINFYEEDNSSKATKINLNKFDAVTLNNILQVVGEQEGIEQ